MYTFDRRTFLKLLGQGTAVLGLGLSLSRRAQSEVAEAQKPADRYFWNDWEFFYPGKYDAQDKKALNGMRAELDLINNKGKVDIDDLISGKLDGKPGIGRATEVTRDNMTQTAISYGANNPMWLDTNYAKKTKWGAMAMPFSIGGQAGVPALTGMGLGDYLVVCNYNVSGSYYKPVYEGDTIYSVIEGSKFVDITPAQGSYYRTFAVIGWGSFYNQKGELVGEGAGIRTESFRRRKDPAQRNPGGAHAWESPDWWSRPYHMYTDEDWEEIKKIWKNEEIRGSKTLYWDDVNIGDEPPPRAVGPVLAEEEIDMLGLWGPVPQWSVDSKLNVLNPETFSKMVKNKQGIYVPLEHLEKKPAAGAFAAGGGLSELSNRDGRAVIQNSVCAQWTGAMIINWMGDDGWLQRLGWDFMDFPPGYTKGVRYDKYPTKIPTLPKKLMPSLFDKFPYLEKVPYMRGKRAVWHPMEGDLIICRACVTDKYRQGNEYFVDLIWWCDTLDKYLVEEGFATVKLPKK
jgi:hypothetical protein